MLDLNYFDNVREIADGLDKVTRDQVPFTLALSMTRAGYRAQKALKTQMTQTFDNPTKWTLNSTRVKAAKKNDLTVRVWYRDYAPKGTPAGDYLKPLTYGTPRTAKRLEWLLRRNGILRGSSQYAIPATRTERDQYGNVSRRNINKVLSGIRAQFDQAQNTTSRKGNRRNRRGGDYFALSAKRGKLPAGIYERTDFGFGSAVKPVYIFTKKAPEYDAEFPFQETVEDTFGEALEEEFPAALDRAMRTAFR